MLTKTKIRLIACLVLMVFSGLPVLQAQRVMPPEAPSRNPARLTVQSEVGNHPECVVLLHGLARTPRSMRKMVQFLGGQGYDVFNIGYPSTRHSVDELTSMVFEAVQEQVSKREYNKVHFIVHSLGGILVRANMKKNPMQNLGRVVMLAPPSQGSEVADKLGGIFLYKWINGPAGLQLGTDPESVPIKLGPVDFECGVLTGRKSINWILSMMFKGENDGKVSVERAKLPGMRDFRVLDVAHPFIMQNPEVMRLSLGFLREGKFPN
jgi:triacylglycerol lipase